VNCRRFAANAVKFWSPRTRKSIFRQWFRMVLRRLRFGQSRWVTYVAGEFGGIAHVGCMCVWFLVLAVTLQFFQWPGTDLAVDAWMPPFSFVALLSSKKHVVRDAIQKFRAEYEALLKAERFACKGVAFWKELVGCIYWSTWPAVRAVYVMLEDVCNSLVCC
jgi:hypothetical protein